MRNQNTKFKKNSIFDKYQKISSSCVDIKTSKNEREKLSNSNLSNTDLVIREQYKKELLTTLNSALELFENSLKKKASNFSSSSGPQNYFCLSILDTKDLKMQLVKISEPEEAQTFKLSVEYQAECKHETKDDTNKIEAYGQTYPSREDVMDFFGIDYGKMSYCEKRLIWYSYSLRSKLPHVEGNN